MDDLNALIQRARELGPWHFSFEIAPGVLTGELNGKDYEDPNKGNVETIDPYHMKSFFRTYFPQGLAGKDLLDVGCNAGGYCFIAAELGARNATGFDIRQHWLDQAEFIGRIKYPQLKNVEFKLGDAKTFLDSYGSADIVIFKGVLYHLPDPLHILLRLAEATREVILIDTASSYAIPEQCWTPNSESRTHVMSGVDGLAWFPGGPAAVRPVLEYAGFRQFEVSYWRRAPHPFRKDAGRFQIIAAR
jgi:tRNA (mo5U34)-methyltransferase